MNKPFDDTPSLLFADLPDQPTRKEAANFFSHNISAMARAIGEDERIDYQPRECAVMMVHVAIGFIVNNGPADATSDQLRAEVDWVVRQLRGDSEAIISAREARAITVEADLVH